MQGQRSSMGALPENVFLDNGSLSVEPIVAPQMPWNSSRTSEQSWLGHTLPSNPNNFQYMQQPRHGEQNLGFSLSGRSSSSSQQVDHSVITAADSWNFRSQSVLSFGNQQQFDSSNTLSLDNNNINAELHSNGNQTTTTTTRRLILPNPISTPLPLDLNASAVTEENGHYDELQQSHARISNNQMLLSGTSNPLSSTSSECLRTSRKRKALDLSVGQSSGEGSSTHFERDTALPRQRGIVIGNGSERINSRLRIGNSSREGIPSSPLSLTTTPVNAMSPHLSSPQQSLLPGNSSYTNLGIAHPSSSGPLGPVLEVNPAPAVENLRLLGQTFAFPPPLAHGNPSHSTWNSSSAIRYGSSSVSEGGSGSAVLEGSAARNAQPRNPLIPEVRSHQNLTNLNWVGRNFRASARNVASYQTQPIQGMNASQPSHQPQRTIPSQYAQRMTEIARRSLLPSAGIESSGQGSANSARSSSSLAHHARAALLARRLTAANIMPERFRRVLEMMRRGEALIFEDAMFLEQSFLAMADMHDRHRDMRMDVDNMSYEELLALEERIGNVCTGLSEGAIKKHMKLRKYVGDKTLDQNEIEPCSICREEYSEGEDLGELECGHGFHRDCIKQWLMQKNVCPICKTTGLKL